MRIPEERTVEMDGVNELIPPFLTTLDRTRRTSVIRPISHCLVRRNAQLLSLKVPTNPIAVRRHGFQPTHAKLQDYIEVILYCKGVGSPQTPDRRRGPPSGILMPTARCHTNSLNRRLHATRNHDRKSLPKTHAMPCFERMRQNQ